MMSWEAERGVLPSQWLEAHPNTCDMLFAIRQYFYRRSTPLEATRFRAKAGIIWMDKNCLCILGKVQGPVRAEALKRFRRAEQEMGLAAAEAREKEGV